MVGSCGRMLRVLQVEWSFCAMTSNTDRNDLMPPQGFKLEWVTPKISLMEAGDTANKPFYAAIEVSKSGGPPAPS